MEPIKETSQKVESGPVQELANANMAPLVNYHLIPEGVIAQHKSAIRKLATPKELEGYFQGLRQELPALWLTELAILDSTSQVTRRNDWLPNKIWSTQLGDLTLAISCRLSVAKEFCEMTLGALSQDGASLFQEKILKDNLPAYAYAQIALAFESPEFKADLYKLAYAREPSPLNFGKVLEALAVLPDSSKLADFANSTLADDFYYTRRLDIASVLHRRDRIVECRNQLKAALLTTDKFSHHKNIAREANKLLGVCTPKNESIAAKLARYLCVRARRFLDDIASGRDVKTTLDRFHYKEGDRAELILELKLAAKYEILKFATPQKEKEVWAALKNEGLLER